MENLVFRYNDERDRNKQSWVNYEFEVRIHIYDIEVFKTIFKGIAEISSHLRTDNMVNIYYNNNIIYNIPFIDMFKDEQHTSYIRKEQKGNILLHNPIDCKIALSREAKLLDYTPNDVLFARIKNRIMCFVSPWRYDFTIVKKVENNDLERIKENRERLFKQDKKIHNTSEQFLNMLSNNVVDGDTFELEIEYDNPKELDKHMVYDELHRVAGYLIKVNDQDELGTIAQFINKQQARGQYQRNQNKPISLRNPNRPLSVKTLGNNVIGLSKETYFNIVAPNLSNYEISDKIDGERCFILINKNECSIIGKTIEKTTAKDVTYNITIADAEYYEPNETYYIFDVMAYYGENLTLEPFDIRRERRKDIVDIMKKFGLKGEVKKETKLTKLKQIKKVYDEQENREYKSDGIIFINNDPTEDTSYNKLTWYKWKPIEKLTIDFLIKALPIQLINIEPFILNESKESKKGKAKKDYIYILFVGISKEKYNRLNLKRIDHYDKIFLKSLNPNYFPIQFTTPDEPNAFIYHSSKDNLDNHIGEFNFEISKKKWKLQRLREDKEVNFEKNIEFGNDYSVALSIWNTYKDPLTIDDLINPSNTYFEQEKDPMYIPITSFISYVKGMLIQRFYKSNYIVDLGTGKGQDLFKYFNNKINNLVAIEPDIAATTELLNRVMSEKSTAQEVIAEKRGQKVQHIEIERTKVQVYNADLTTSYKELLEGVEKFNLPISNDAGDKYACDGVIANLSIHYFAYTPTLLSNLVKFIGKILKPSGLFIVTCLNGDKIQELLKDYKKGETWEIKDGDVIKYAIKKLYSEKDDPDQPKKIAIKLPFATELREEYLISPNNIVNAFQKTKFEYEQNSSFSKMLPMFAKVKPKAFDSLSIDDKTYLDLYSFISLWKFSRLYKALQINEKKKEKAKEKKELDKITEKIENIEIEETEETEETEEEKPKHKHKHKKEK